MTLPTAHTITELLKRRFLMATLILSHDKLLVLHQHVTYFQSSFISLGLIFRTLLYIFVVTKLLLN